jgi:hypothetical protein
VNGFQIKNGKPTAAKLGRFGGGGGGAEEAKGG